MKMESTEVIIARLVLGYLKGTKCKSAYKEFLRTSNHLQDDISFTKSKYLPTRFVGLTLEDILSEYFEIYKIVQGRLESTNYYNEHHSKHSLVLQLLYLLNKVLSSRTSTPCPRSPVESNVDDISISPEEHISDVEATPAHTLPGNIRSTTADSHFHKTAWRKPYSKHDKPATETNFQSPEKEDISEVLAHTLLENREFHEKIAQTINKVAEKQNRVSSELDKTIKTVVKETEEDPIFDKILDEIIGSTNIIDDKGIETSSATSSVDKSTNEIIDIRWKRSQKLSNSTDEYDPGYKSYTDSQKVEEQNNEAIRSIVANSKLSANKHVDNRETRGNSEVIVFDGSLDKYLKSNTCNANTQTQPMQNPLYINATGGLLMVPSSVKTVTGNVQQMNSSNQYYFVNNQPKMNCGVAVNTPNIMTEQDILAMPTVIVNDEKQVKNTPSKLVAESILLKPISESPTPHQIIPKPLIEIPNVEAYFSFQRQMESQHRGLKKVLYPTKKRRKPSESAVNSKTLDVVPPRTTTTSTDSDVQNATESFPDNLDKVKKNQPTKDGNDSHESKLTQSQQNKNENKTPPLSKISQKVTPKSSSHVRNLDFSTPPKITSTHKRSMKSKQGSKSPETVPKAQATKILFKSNDSESTDKDGYVSESTNSKLDLKTNTAKSKGTWDADLRAIIPVVEGSARPALKKKKRNVKKPKKKLRKPTNVVIKGLNNTEHDAALLEAALQTPVKPVVKTKKVEVMEQGLTENICESPENDQVKRSEVKTKKNKSQIKVRSRKKSECIRESKENPEETPNKLILSPSKLNANKRKLKTEIPIIDLANMVTDLPTEGSNNFITPEMVKETVNYPIKANRNITPMLDTPLKDAIPVPKTPRFLSPGNAALDLSTSINGLTPFTKMLEANLKGIDINSLPTPCVPITPTFPPFTPTIDLVSPYSNRPTDYSTSSSYYQPSDSEQNRSLEANLMELEKKPIVVLNDSMAKEDMAASVDINDEVNECVIAKEHTKTPSSAEIKNEVSHKDQNKLVHATTVKEHLSIFNKNVIGKKNLNLMKRHTPSNSSSSEDSVSEDSSNESSNWNGEQSNETVIFKKKLPETPKRIYSLRNRCTGTKTKQETISKSTDTKETKVVKNQSGKELKINAKPSGKQTKESTVVVKTDVHHENVKGGEITVTDVNKRLAEITSSKQKVLKELEEKRLRTIKNIQNTTSNKATRVSKQSKFIKIKPIANITNSRRKPRKSASPKKAIQNIKQKKNEEAIKESQALRSCKDVDKSSDKSASDVEAQNLIEGLKERGIHLMHNKSPIKKVTKTSTQSKVVEETENIASIDSNILTVSKNTTSISPATTKQELSTTQLESESRETYDIQTFEEYECVVFDESKKFSKTLEDYTKTLTKKFMGKVFLEEIDAEIEIPLVLSPFITLFDFSSTLDLTTEQTEDSQKIKNSGKVAQPKKIGNKKDVEKPEVNKYDPCLIRDVINPAISDDAPKSDDDLMNYAVIGSGKEETPERSGSPQNTRKRKHQNEENSHTEKKCKTLLQNINVDSFLNNIHGGS